MERRKAFMKACEVEDRITILKINKQTKIHECVSEDFDDLLCNLLRGLIQDGTISWEDTLEKAITGIRGRQSFKDR
jgi:hypothetical protein